MQDSGGVLEKADVITQRRINKKHLSLPPLSMQAGEIVARGIQRLRRTESLSWYAIFLDALLWSRISYSHNLCVSSKIFIWYQQEIFSCPSTPVLMTWSGIHKARHSLYYMATLSSYQTYLSLAVEERQYRTDCLHFWRQCKKFPKLCLLFSGPISSRILTCLSGHRINSSKNFRHCLVYVSRRVLYCTRKWCHHDGSSHQLLDSHSLNRQLNATSNPSARPAALTR